MTLICYGFFIMEKLTFNTRRIYYEVSEKVLTSNNQSYYYLTFLKLQNYCSQNGGYFSISNVQSALNSSLKTSQTHISKLIELGYITYVSKNLYRIKSQKKLTTAYKKQYIIIQDVELSKYSYRNISEFRALLMLIIDKKFQNTKQFLIKQNELRPTKGKYSKQAQDDTLGEYHDLLSCSISAFKCNKSKSTISRWRKKQSKVSYTSYKIAVRENLAHLTIEEVNILNPLNDLGVYYRHRGHLMFSSISKVAFNGFCLKRYR